MIVKQVTYICDCCGNRVSIDLDDIEDIYGMPDKWVKFSDESNFGTVCERCYGELRTVYDRIHAPLRALNETRQNNNSWR